MIAISKFSTTHIVMFENSILRCACVKHFFQICNPNFIILLHFIICLFIDKTHAFMVHIVSSILPTYSKTKHLLVVIAVRGNLSWTHVRNPGSSLMDQGLLSDICTSKFKIPIKSACTKRKDLMVKDILDS